MVCYGSKGQRSGLGFKHIEGNRGAGVSYTLHSIECPPSIVKSFQSRHLAHGLRQFEYFETNSLESLGLYEQYFIRTVSTVILLPSVAE